MRGSISASKLRRRRKVCLEVLEDRQLLSTITVNTTTDGTAAASTLSLREAIEVSNGTLPVSSLSTQQQHQVSGTVGNTNTIDFNIPKTDPGYNATTGVWTIAVQSALPAVTTNAAIINGYSQPGSSPNTLAQGDNAKLTIELQGPGLFFDGLTLGQPGSRVSGLDIQNFTNGVVLTAPGNAQVAGCFIGTDPMGETAPHYNQTGIYIENSSNLIGGPNLADRNVISGNLGPGAFVPYPAINPLGIAVTGTVYENNIIGLDAAGKKALGNGGGIVTYGNGETVGGTTAGLGNVISGNGGVGIASKGSITIESNYVGTDVTGNVAIGNGNGGGEGIDSEELLKATSITTVIANNVVSGNSTGIQVTQTDGSASAYAISNNLIGTNAAGTAALGNSIGLQLNNVENATVQNNVISANYTGVWTQTDTAVTELQHDVFQGNLIGTDKTGTVALGNKDQGIDIETGSGLTFGGTGPGQGNVIANCGQYGILLNLGQQDQFIHNSIYNDGFGGISLVPSTNDSAVAPVLAFTPGTSGNGALSGTLNWAPNTAYTVEIYSSPAAPTPGKAQGQTFVKDVTVNTDGTGKGTFSLSEPDIFYTATATDPNGNTSAFSNSVGETQALPASMTAVSSSANPSMVGQQVTFTAVVTATSYQGTPTGTVTFTIDGQAQTPVSLSVVGGKDEAQFVTSTLTAGSHTVTAAYSGDTNVSPSSGSLPTQTVSERNLQATTTTLSSSLVAATVGQEVTFTAVVSPGASAGTATGTVTFTIDGTPETPVSLQAVKGSEQAAFSVATLTAGKHTIGATYSGDSTFASSAVASSLIQTVNPVTQQGGSPGGGSPAVDGPTVVSLRRFGIHMQPTVLVLNFNDGLDPTSAQDLRNYKIVDPDGRSISIDSAIFDPAANTVTLRPKSRINLHHAYHLTVIGTGATGVRDSRGLLLDGANTGQPGSNYTGTLTGDNVVWTPAEYKKYVHPQHTRPTGPMSHRFL